ncbi:MAG: hypothetical protein COC24_000090 [Alphaproteobacteria bacterium]|nr:hypothetical protein [Alphaproteobacteria bacterium]MBL1418885.1 hypothetical protein [Alphaproteobacteria bacterium]
MSKVTIVMLQSIVVAGGYNYRPNEVVEVSKATADEFIAAGWAEKPTQVAQQKLIVSELKKQVVHDKSVIDGHAKVVSDIEMKFNDAISEKDSANAELTETILVVTAARDELAIENVRLTEDLTGMTGIKIGDTERINELLAENEKLTNEIADMRNEPVDDGDDEKLADETAGDEKSSDATTGDGDKSSDAITGDGDAGDVKPAVVVGADGKRKKAMPRKGGVAAE